MPMFDPSTTAFSLSSQEIEEGGGKASGEHERVTVDPLYTVVPEHESRDEDRPTV